MAKPRKAPTSSIVLNAVYTDDRFLELEPIAQLAFVAALGQVDVFGNITADPAKLQTYVLPMHRFGEQELSDIFDAFVDAGLAFYYERNGCRYVHLYLTNNARVMPPEYPLPPGLTAKKPENKGRRAIYRIYDDSGVECDPDGDPIDNQIERTLPAWTSIGRTRDIRRTYDGRTRDVQGTYKGHTTDVQCTAKQHNTEQNRTSGSVFVPKTEPRAHAGAGATLEGSPAPQAADEDAMPDPDFSRMIERVGEK